MKKWSIIIAAALVATWMVVDMVREFFANDTIQYFSSEPHRLIYVALIGLAGGLVALAFDSLSPHISPQIQRRVRLFAWGAAASTLTTSVAYIIFCLAPLSSFLIESGNTPWLLLALVLLLLSGIASYLWFEFYRAWTTRNSK